MKNTHAVSMLLCMFLAVYSTLCSPQPSDVAFVWKVDAMFSSNPSESVKIGSGQDTFVSSSTAAVVIFFGHLTRSGCLASVGDKKKVYRRKVQQYHYCHLNINHCGDAT